MSRRQPAPPASAPSPLPWVGLSGALLLLLTLAAYLNALRAPLIFDDRAAILENPTIRDLFSPQVLQPPASASGAAGRPVVNLSLALNHALGGTAPFGYRLLNVLLHAATGLLLFGLTRRLLSRPQISERIRRHAMPAAAAGAALWLFHPLQTESVTFVIQRSEILGGFFLALCLYAFVRAAESDRNRAWLAVSVAASALGMAAKEFMVVAPVLVFLCDRTFFAGPLGAAWRAHAGYYAALAATWLILVGLLISGGGSRGEAAGFGLGVSPWHYLLTQCRAIGIYLQLTFWPHPLVLDYGAEVVRDPLAVLPQALLLLALFGLALRSAWRRQPVGFAGLAFFAILSPSSSVVPLVAQTIAEHRMYLPLAAVILPACSLLWGWLGSRAWPVAAALVAVGLALTIQRNQDYRSEVAIWTDTVAKAPANARAQLNLAEVLILDGHPAEALPHAAEAVRLRPDYPEAQMNLGIALAQTGRPADALPHAEEAVRRQPDSLRARSNLGVVLAMLGRMPEAATQLEAALKLGPMPAEALSLHQNLARVYVQLRRHRDAAGQFAAILRLDPANAGAAEALEALRPAPP